MAQRSQRLQVRRGWLWLWCAPCLHIAFWNQKWLEVLFGQSSRNGRLYWLYMPCLTTGRSYGCLWFWWFDVDLWYAPQRVPPSSVYASYYKPTARSTQEAAVELMYGHSRVCAYDSYDLKLNDCGNFSCGTSTQSQGTMFLRQMSNQPNCGVSRHEKHGKTTVDSGHSWSTGQVFHSNVFGFKVSILLWGVDMGLLSGISEDMMKAGLVPSPSQLVQLKNLSYTEGCYGLY